MRAGWSVKKEKAGVCGAERASGRRCVTWKLWQARGGVRVAFTAPVMVAGEQEAVEGSSAAGMAAGDPAHPRERRQTPKQSVSKAGRSRWI